MKTDSRDKSRREAAAPPGSLLRADESASQSLYTQPVRWVQDPPDAQEDPADPAARTDGDAGLGRRRKRQRRATDGAIERWLSTERSAETQAGGSSPFRKEDDAPGVVAPLPRRKIEAKQGEPAGTPSKARKTVFRARIPQTIARLMLWIWAFIRYAAGTLFDIITFRNSIQRRAVRLRLIFEGLGATFIKLGQQLSVRADFLPFEYCEELAKMLDKVAPFPTEQAIRTIERDLGRKLGDIFAVFDPQPIGSASLACVYQAILHNGERVAVKVRRPGISSRLAADLRALSWFLSASELLTLARTGVSKNFLLELNQMFSEELDFYQEARHTELFRRFAAESEQRYLSAPHVYFELLSENVLVTEFISGVFLQEILLALDRQDTKALDDLKSKGFDPAAIAKGLVMAFNYEMVEGMFFHADPHPANIVVRPGNMLVFIDFGSCGRITRKARRLWIQTQQCVAQRDVQGLVKCTISYMEPLPAIDLESFMKEVEGLYWNWMYAIHSEHAEWWEKASGQMWMKFASIAQRYNIPMNLDSLRMFRATFLYDTVMLRLWKHLDMAWEYQRYFRLAGARARRRVRGDLRTRLRKGFTNSDYMAIEEMWRLGQQLMTRVQHVLDEPSFSFSSMVGKMAFGVSTMLRILALACSVYLALWIISSGHTIMTGREIDISSMVRAFAQRRWAQPVLLLVALLMLRKLLMRLQDVERNK